MRPRSALKGLSDGAIDTMDAAYVNYLGEEGEDRVRSSYGLKYDRLAALKDTYDPTNFFRMNQNIKPSRSGSAMPAAGRRGC